MRKIFKVGSKVECGHQDVKSPEPGEYYECNAMLGLIGEVKYITRYTVIVDWGERFNGHDCGMGLGNRGWSCSRKCLKLSVQEITGKVKVIGEL